jgi:hypothetical protein
MPTKRIGNRSRLLRRPILDNNELDFRRLTVNPLPMSLCWTYSKLCSMSNVHHAHCFAPSFGSTTRRKIQKSMKEQHTRSIFLTSHALSIHSYAPPRSTRDLAAADGTTLLGERFSAEFVSKPLARGGLARGLSHHHQNRFRLE